MGANGSFKSQTKAGHGEAWRGRAWPGEAWEPMAHFHERMQAMKEAIQEITEAVNKLWAMSAKYDRGQTIDWGKVEVIAGSRTDGRANYIVNKWRKRMERERAIVILVEPNVGVRLLTDKETAIEIPRLRQKRAYRQIRRALKQTALVNDASLSVNDRRLLAAQRIHMAEQRRSLHRSQKELKSGVVKTEGNPRRVAVA